MKTVNSLSGGKTSSYIAAHYPADIDVFSLVCIDAHNAGGNIDRKMKQMVNDKLQKYCSNMPEFVATAEDPLTLKVMFDLEQHIGREIIWVRGVDFFEAIRIKMAIPNRNKRFCTTILKIYPIFWLLYLYFELPVTMRIGYRYDEKERADTFKETFKFPTHCEKHMTEEGYYRQVGRYPVHKHGFSYAHRWKEVPFRVPEFPLIKNEIIHRDIIDYWSDKGIDFPKDSNCQFCFWKHPMQLRKNFDINPGIMHAAMIMEEMNDNRFHDGISMFAVKKQGIQQDLFNEGFSVCHGGYCTS